MRTLRCSRVVPKGSLVSSTGERGCALRAVSCARRVARKPQRALRVAHCKPRKKNTATALLFSPHYVSLYSYEKALYSNQLFFDMVLMHMGESPSPSTELVRD